MSCIQQILRHGTSHVSQAYKPNGLSLREIGDNEKKNYLKRNTTLWWRKKPSWLHTSCTMSTKVSQETNVLIIIKQVFTTYFSELSNSPEKTQTRNTTFLLFVRYAAPPPKTPLWKQSNAWLSMPYSRLDKDDCISHPTLTFEI